MADQLIGSLIDNLTYEQCAEMQRIVELNGAPFDAIMDAIRDASPEVLEALTLTIMLPDLLRGERVSEELAAAVPRSFWQQIWRAQPRH
ncbi:MAG: hypothetical protein AAF515_14755 [Pseudomonadota bacterium]